MTHPTGDSGPAPADATHGIEPAPASAPAPPSAPTPPPPPAEPRQRWRLTFAREPVAGDQVGRSTLDAWQDALIASGLPWAGIEPGGAGRARIAFAAPLPAIASGDAELVELWLLERLPLWRVREALADRLPAAHRWIGAENVWLGAPALAGRVVAADWRVAIGRDGGLGGDRLAAAARDLLAATALPRTRLKGTVEKRYDLRPLLADVAVLDRDGDHGGVELRIRTRFEPEAGSGRPEEVVAALAEAAAVPIDIVAIVRERLLLAEPQPIPPPSPRRPKPAIRPGFPPGRR